MITLTDFISYQMLILSVAKGLQSLYDKESAEEAKETNSKFISITEEALARIQGVELHSVPEVGVIVVLKWPVVNMPLSDAQAVTKTLPYTQFDLDDISDMNTLKTTISRHYEPWKITNVEEQHNAKENEPDSSSKRNPEGLGVY